MQDIADAVGVSRITVWKVFNNQEGVSDSLRTQIISKATELGYAKVMPDAAESKTGGSKTVSVIVSRPESSHFWMNIIHRIAKEMSKQKIDFYIRMFLLPVRPDICCQLPSRTEPSRAA